MTDEQKYDELLKEIGFIIHEKNQTIYWKEYEITQLKAKLEAAEKLISELKDMTKAETDAPAEKI